MALLAVLLVCSSLGVECWKGLTACLNLGIFKGPKRVLLSAAVAAGNNLLALGKSATTQNPGPLLLY